MRKRIVTKIGDIFEVKVSDTHKRYFQYIAIDRAQLGGSTIRVFKTSYPLERKVRLQEIVEDEVEFYSHCVLRAGIESGLWEKVGKVPLNETPKALFRTAIDLGPHIIISEKWEVWELGDPTQTYVGRLKGKYRYADYGEILAPHMLFDRIKTGKWQIKCCGFIDYGDGDFVAQKVGNSFDFILKDLRTQWGRACDSIARSSITGSKPPFFTTDAVRILRLEINGFMQQIDRCRIYEDPLDEMLQALKIGCVTGGGSFVDPITGRIIGCDVEIVLKDYTEETFEQFLSVMTALNAPKGSQISSLDSPPVPFGDWRGMCLRLRKSYAPKFYKKYCYKELIKRIDKVMRDFGYFFSSYYFDKGVEFYFYGSNPLDMQYFFRRILDNFPLCRGYEIEEIS